MGVNVHTFAFGLNQQFLQVLQVVAAYQDAGPVADADLDFRLLGIAVSGCVGLVQQGHGLDTTVADIEHKRQQFVHADVGTVYLCQRVLYDCINVVALVSQIQRVPCVGRHALAAVYGQLLQAAYVGILLIQYAEEFPVERAAGLHNVEPAVIFPVDVIGNLGHIRRPHA